MFKTHTFVESQSIFGNILRVKYSDGSYKYYDAVKLGCEWFKMSNDSFSDLYGFNFNPHNVPGLYEKCRKIVFGI